MHELSELSEREALKHIETCSRCREIYLSLAKPDEIRQSYSKRPVVRPMIVGLLLVFAVVVAATSFLYFGSESKPVDNVMVDAPISLGSEIDEFSEGEVSMEKEVAPILEAIDTLSQINEEPEENPPLPTNKQFDQYIEKEQVQPRIKLRGIYGKITADGQPLSGVTVRVPGSNSGRISDDGGKYYIQVPRNTKTLLFIYQGKQLVKNLDPDSRRLDIYLKSESLSFPESQEPENQVNAES